jgi:hypothetical protein
MKQTLKDIVQNLDLYGEPVLIEALKKQFSHVSYTLKAKKIPTCGSICRQSKDITPSNDLKIERVIFHKDGKVSILTDKKQYFQFLNI